MKHASSVIATVDRAVPMLSPNVDPLIQVLQDLGTKHAQYGALPAHYGVVGLALIETLQATMGDKSTKEVETAWERIYDIISTAMIEAVKKDIVH